MERMLLALMLNEILELLMVRDIKSAKTKLSHLINALQKPEEVI